MKAYLSRVDTPAGSIFNEKRDTCWASRPQRMVGVEEELRESQAVGDEGGRLGRNEFSHGFEELMILE